MSAPATEFDVAVVGGGMTGLVTAIGLQQRGLTCVVIEPRPPSEAPSPADELRVVTLTPASCNVLAVLGSWPVTDANPFFDMRVWEDGDRSDLVFSARDAGLAELGVVARVAEIRRALWSQLDQDLTLEAGVVRVTLSGRGATLHLSNDQIIKAGLIVGSEGASSLVREAAGIEWSEADYHQKGLVCTVESEVIADTAWQRFLPGGPLAFLPLGEKRFSLVWSMPTSECIRAMECAEGDFLARLQAASQDRLGELKLVSQRASFPLRRRVARRYVAPRVALVGDAAHVVHPLAGQGANLGFLDAAALVEVCDNGVPDDSRLRQYERWRRADNAVMQATLDSLIRLFRAPDPIAGLRQIGGQTLQRLPWFKARLIEHASGFGGKVPQLARKGPEAA